jgi:hypothetical protein
LIYAIVLALCLTKHKLTGYAITKKTAVIHLIALVLFILLVILTLWLLFPSDPVGFDRGFHFFSEVLNAKSPRSANFAKRGFWPVG